MKNQRITFRDLTAPLLPWQFWVLSIVAPVFFQFITWRSSFSDWHTFFVAFSWYSIVGITQSLGHSYVGLKLDEILPWEKYATKRLFATVTAITIYAIIAYVIVGSMLAYVWIEPSLSKAFIFALNGIWIAVIISFIFAFIFASISFFINWQKSKTKTERLQKELATHQYNTLKNQVNPHFLFNSLNVLTDLVHEDADLAEKYIQQLSKIYRYVLESTKHQTILLSKELAFIESYAFLLKIRFGEKLIININTDPDSNDFIVPVSLQMLIENAVKHNEQTNDKPLTINILQTKNYIIVQNNLQLKTTHQESSGTGLDNLSKQYKSLQKEPIQITNSDGLFSAKVPIIHLQNKPI